MSPMQRGGEDLTQTQNFGLSQLPLRPPADSDVIARLVSLVDAGQSYEIRRDQQQVEIGRHPECQIHVEDKRASGRHLRIYRDEAFHFFIEELSANGAFCNDHHMMKGNTRALQHGDALSLCLHHASKPPNAPFAAYIFRLTDHVSDPPAPVKSPKRAVSTVTMQLTAPEGPAHLSKMVTDQWVVENWDMRTQLGSGNFSEVRLGVPVKREGAEKCAVKVIDKKRFLQFQSKRESKLSLQSEAEMLMSLNHPGIIRFFEWFETEDKLYIAMEYLQGGDLLQYILEKGCFAESAARRLFREIAGAVKYLHDKNIVHRDLKPENILLTSKVLEQMSPKLADFGLARKNMKTKDCKTFCGTPHYFAPEIITTFQKREDGQDGGYGKQADMWSLGVILYIMLSGIPPFEEDGLYQQILEGKYEFDVDEWNQVSLEAKELVRQLMHVNPIGRLNIQRTLQHKWFTLEQETIPRVAEVRPPPGGEEAITKRRRTLGGEGTGAMAVDSVSLAVAPLGA